MRDMRWLLVLVAVMILPGADCLGPLDDDDGEPVLVGTDGGEVQRLSASEEQVSVSWTASIDPSNQVLAAPARADGLVASGQELRGFGRDSGDELWDAPVSFASDVVALTEGSGLVFALTFDSLVALDVSDGAEAWRVELFDLGDPADAALAFGAGAVFVGGNPIARINASTGATTHTADGSSSISDIVVSGSTLYVGSPDGVQALSASDLSEDWLHPTASEVDHVAVGSVSVFYSVFGGGVGALTLSGNPTGTALDGDVVQALAIGGNLLLAARSDGLLFAFDEADVSEVWNVAGDSEIWALSVNDQTVFYATGGALDGLNLADSSSLWSFTSSGRVVAAEAL